MWNIFVVAGALATIGALTIYFITARREIAKLPPLKSQPQTIQKKAQKRDKKQARPRRAENPVPMDGATPDEPPPSQQS